MLPPSFVVRAVRWIHYTKVPSYLGVVNRSREYLANVKARIERGDRDATADRRLLNAICRSVPKPRHMPRPHSHRALRVALLPAAASRRSSASEPAHLS